MKVKEIRFSSTWNHVSANEDRMKVYVIQSKNGIMINAGVCLKN